MSRCGRGYRGYDVTSRIEQTINVMRSATVTNEGQKGVISTTLGTTLCLVGSRVCARINGDREALFLEGSKIKYENLHRDSRKHDRSTNRDYLGRRHVTQHLHSVQLS